MEKNSYLDNRTKNELEFFARGKNSYFVTDLNNLNNFFLDIVENTYCKNVDDKFHLNHYHLVHAVRALLFTYNSDEHLLHLVDQASVEHNIDKECDFVQDDIDSSLDYLETIVDEKQENLERDRT